MRVPANLCSTKAKGRIDATNEARAGRPTRCIEPLCLRWVHQQFGGHFAAGFLLFLGSPSGRGNSGKPPSLFSAKSIHAYARGIHSQRRGRLTLANAEVVEAAGVGELQQLAAAAQRGIHAVCFDHRGADQRCVAVHVVHRDKEREVTLTLHNPEGEAAPLQWTGVSRWCARESRRRSCGRGGPARIRSQSDR